MLQRRKLSLFFTFSIGILLSCSSSDKKSESDNSPSGSHDTIGTYSNMASPVSGEVEPIDYSNWKKISHENVDIIYPPNHPHESSLQNVAEGFVRIGNQVSNFLRIPFPSTQITIFYYTGFGQGRGWTGLKHPHIVGDTIHYWMPHRPALPMVDYLIGKWHSEPTRYEFLKHGLMRFLDYSGVNYHEKTLNMMDADSLVPLTQLYRDTTVQSYEYSPSSHEAASFIAFFVDSYGFASFNKLYQMQLPFDAAVKNICGISLDNLQTRWLHYADSTYRESIR